MKFTPEQDKALLAADEWIKNGTTQVFHLFGYAGTGKTTLAKHLAQNVDGEVLFAAYTGKAAHVLRSKGCHNASTIHSLIYNSREKSKAHLAQLEEALAQLLIELQDMDEEYINNHPRVRDLRRDIKKEIENIEQPIFTKNPDSQVKTADMVVIDECSMVGGQMGQDLLSYGTPVMVIGDPAQLPPIGDGGFFTENITPHVMLEDIHRQAQESPILRMATDTRLKKPLRVGDWGNDCHVIGEGVRLSPEEILGMDQLLVGKNTTRHASNAKIRKLLDINDKYPIVGDRLVCLKNHSELGLMNGAIFYVTDVEGVLDDKVFMSVKPEDGIESVELSAHEHFFLGTEDSLNYWQRKDAREFAYGYALTVHKAQGSQWNSVGIFDESWCFRENRWRWLYTAITRAAEKITVVKM
jgi:exodeoxyribonuclease-5